MAKLQKWLKEHPLDLAEKDNFFNCEIKSYTRILTKTLTSKKGLEHAMLWNNNSWESGLAMNVRLINIVTSDAYKRAFIKHDDKISVSQLDVLGTEKATVSFWDQVQLTFNDRNYSTKLEILHADWGGHYFLEAQNLDWSKLDKIDVLPLHDGRSAKSSFMKLCNKMTHV